MKTAVALVLSLALISGCASLPSLEGRVASSVIADTAGTRLGAAVAPLTSAHPGYSGVYALPDGRDAFAARVLLANAAERSLDVQYYIWRNDITGTLMLDALRAAAARGVRVRLLLDDNNTTGLDSLLATLDALPNLEVRLFNPFAGRSMRMLGYLNDFSRLNRRMHNKSFTADGQATIIGGRNVGDEYFGAAGDMLFADLDVMAIGPVVGAVAQDFDRYWNSRSAYPVDLLATAAKGEAANVLAREAATLVQGDAARAYVQAMRESPFVAQLVERSLPLEWAETLLVSDDPDKVLGQVAPASLVSNKLQLLMGEPRQEVYLVSPYFVPGAQWAGRFASLARQGVKVNILTNSLEATDVAAVHAGYAKWRKPMLEAGVTLYELKRSWPVEGGRAKSGSGSGSGSFGSSDSSLHAKTFSVDKRKVFIGSFNFDPRSAELNTEMGFVIDSPSLAAKMDEVLRKQVPERAYKVGLAADGTLFWTEQGATAPKPYDTEPGTTFWQRSVVGFISLLPIDWLL